MGQRHLVRGQMSGWFTAGRFAGPVLMAAGLIGAFAGNPAGGIAVIVGGLALTITMEAIAFKRRSQRVWIEPLDDGFIVVDGKGEREHRDHEVVSIAYSSKTNYSNGEPSGYTRKCQFWFTSAPAVVMDSTYGNNVADPVNELIVRVLELLKRGYKAALEHGIPVTGDKWQLTTKELRCTVRGREEVIPLDEISAVETFEGQMGIWLRGQDEPAIKFPSDGRNVWLLPALLEPYLTPATNDGPPKDGLGRVLFNRKPTKGVAVLCVLLAVGAGVGSLFLFAIGMREPGALVAGAFAVLLIPVLLAMAWHYSVSQFRCHEWGVFKSTVFGKQQLLYRDVASFSYGATRHYHNGVYTGTHLNLRFDPNPGSGSTIAYNTTVQGGDDDLENLKDFVSRVIAEQMRQRIAAGNEVRWTNNLTFRPDGIVYRPSGWVSRKEPVFLPYEFYGGYNMDQGIFYLFDKREKKAIMNEAVSEANFFPGFYLLLMLLHQPAEVEQGVE